MTLAMSGATPEDAGLASGLINIGMSWTQAIMTIFLGNLIVLVPMLLIAGGFAFGRSGEGWFARFMRSAEDAMPQLTDGGI